MHFSKLFAGLTLASASAFGQGFLTSESSYLTAAPSANFTFQPIITVGDRVPLTGGAPGEEFAFAGIPDAQGIYTDPVTGERILFCAHETGNSTATTPIVGAGALRGAFVSRFVMSPTGAIVSGGVAHKDLFLGNTFQASMPPQQATFPFTGNLTSGSNVVTGIAGATLASLTTEMVVTGSAIPSNTVITAINLGASTVTLSQNATANGTATTITAGARSFTRFCSGSFAGREHGMDRPLFFTNEETFASASYETTKGAQTVVVADGKMYTVPALGRVGRESTLIQPRRDALTVAMSFEDAGAPSYIYMYVGTKQRRSNSVLDKNGLTGGKTYVLCGRDAQHNEGTFTSGSLPVKWVEIVNAANLTDAQLIVAADAAGAFGFVRVEESEFDPTQPTRSLFIGTTGGSGPNRLGRLYELTMNPTNPVANGTLNFIYNADTIVYPSGSYSGALTGTLDAANGATGNLGAYTQGAIGTTDYPVSIDNLAVSKDFIVIQEDRNSPADAVFANFGRNGGLWTLNRNSGYAAKLQCTFNYAYVASRDSNLVSSYSAGLWESSGVTVSSGQFGAGTFILNVQAHGNASQRRSNIPKPGGGVYTKAEAQSLFAEDGQILIMRPIP